MDEDALGLLIGSLRLTATWKGSLRPKDVCESVCMRCERLSCDLRSEPSHLRIEFGIDRIRDRLLLGRRVQNDLLFPGFRPVHRDRDAQYPLRPDRTDPFSKVDEFARLVRSAPLQFGLSAEKLRIAAQRPKLHSALIA